MNTGNAGAPAAPAAPAAAAAAAPVAPNDGKPAAGTLASAAAAQPAPNGKPAEPAAPAAPADPAKAAASVAPEKYDLKLPENAVIDASVLERTAATARELGLSNEHAQKVVNALNQEAATAQQAAVETALKSHQPGGAEWVKQETAWRDAVLQDPELGDGKPEQLEAAVTAGSKVLAKYGTPELGQFLETTGLGSHPAVLKFVARLGKAMGEGDIVKGPPASPTKDDTEEGRAARMFPSMQPKP